jgi:PAS domain S-box-containing protein
MNPEAERLLGWTMDELNEKGAHSLIHSKKADGTPLPLEECGMHSVITTGKRFSSADEVFMRKDGTVFPISVISSPIRENGKVVESVTAFRDITERKRLERELMKARNLESIGLLAGGIAHDFNNLLQGLLGNIQLAKMHLKPGDQAYHCIEQAENVYSTAKDLAHQLLTFAKGGSPVKRPVLIGEKLRQWVNFALSGSHLKGDFTIDESSCPVEIDEGQMRQVIQNLVINAREAMPEGGVLRVRSQEISLSTEERPPLKEGVYMKISIQDQGTGIPEEYITRIFDPYFSTKNIGNQKGMGLGLTICYSIVKNHGGLLTVESEEGKGSTFHIYLPVAEKELSKDK